ncbi:MAG: glycerophosphodiester phosphodiesterase [Dehalococcoidia bacterium]|nr:glycerophosphodiester phosphodiesterase [Dehalococcoidia bacterium]
MRPFGKPFGWAQDRLRAGPLVISHAACGGHAPENTLAGVRAALDIGADAIEIDVQASADGIPVLMHDLTLDRTTSGKGELSSFTAAQLATLDAGGEPVPTFAQALELTRGRALLVAEIKRPGCEEALADVVRSGGTLADVMVWSFLPPALEAMRRAEPRLPGGLLVAPQSMGNWRAMRELALRLGMQAVSVFHLSLDAEVVSQARRSGLTVYAWTADAEAHIQRLIELDIDGIVTNFPERALALLGRLAGRP